MSKIYAFALASQSASISASNNRLDAFLTARHRRYLANAFDGWETWLNREREELVDLMFVSERAYPADYRSPRHKLSSSDRSTRLAALIVVVLSSLGLWCLIWLAVSTLASALP